MKTCEVELVKNIVRLRDPLAGLLALPNKPTFKDYLILQTEKRSLHSSILALKRDDAYRNCFLKWIRVDRAFYESSGFLLILRAGFPVHCRATRMQTALVWENSASGMSQAAWACLRIFSDFLARAIRHAANHIALYTEHPSGAVRAERSDTFTNRSVGNGILQLALHSGIPALEDLLDHRYYSKDIVSMPDVEGFMRMFVADHFRKSVLVGEDGLLDYGDHLCRTHNTASIDTGRERILRKDCRIKLWRIDQNWLGNFNSTFWKMPESSKREKDPCGQLRVTISLEHRYAPQAILTLTGIMAAAHKGEDGLLSKLNRIGVDNTPLAASHVVEATALGEPRQWSCPCSHIMLGRRSISIPPKHDFIMSYIQARTQSTTSATYGLPAKLEP